MTQFTVIRHGQTVFNAEHRWQGWLDSPLTPLGVQQAHLAGKKVASQSYDYLIVSPLGRAIQTMEIIKPYLVNSSTIPIVLLDSIKERNVGHLQGIPTPEILTKFPEEMESRMKDPLNWHPKEGESSQQFILRAEEAAQELCNNYPHKSLLVIAHGGICAQWHRYFTQANPLDAWEYKIPNASLSRYEFKNNVWKCLFTEITPKDESMDWISS